MNYIEIDFSSIDCIVDKKKFDRTQKFLKDMISQMTVFRNFHFSFFNHRTAETFFLSKKISQTEKLKLFELIDFITEILTVIKKMKSKNSVPNKNSISKTKKSRKPLQNEK